MRSALKKIWNEKPLAAILWVAFLVRLVAVIFSKGFGWHDDHFLVIEVAQAWADGSDYNNWLPGSGASQPDGHSFFYSGIHFFIFKLMNFLHLHDPQVKMYFIRLLHALFSLLIVLYGYKITEKLKGEAVAKTAGLLLALYWFMPFLSVRNLAEFVTIPFLLWGCWKIISNDSKAVRTYVFAGFILGLAWSVRFQSAIMLAGILAALLVQKQFRAFIFVGAGSVIAFCLTQMPADYLVWKKPFAEFAEYIRYNLASAQAYEKNKWYSYLLLLGGMLVPPVSLFLLFGFLKSWKKHLLLFLPAFLFLVFHSYFPNKQERFILTIVPFIIVLGVIGWNDFMETRPNRNGKLLKGCLVFSVVLNFLLLPFITTMYSKRARVESMTYLSRYPSIRAIVMEDERRGDVKIPPEFYLGHWISVGEVSGNLPLERLKHAYAGINQDSLPDYVLFCEDYELQKRVLQMKTVFPELTFETVIHPGFIDDLLFRLNPKNANQVIYIYRTKKNKVA